jgi:hypothetical protein
MGSAASTLGGSGTGRSPRLTNIITSKAAVSAKEAPAEYERKALGSANNDKTFNASKALQQMMATILISTDMFTPS